MRAIVHGSRRWTGSVILRLAIGNPTVLFRSYLAWILVVSLVVNAIVRLSMPHTRVVLISVWLRHAFVVAGSANTPFRKCVWIWSRTRAYVAAVVVL